MTYVPNRTKICTTCDKPILYNEEYIGKEILDHHNVVTGNYRHTRCPNELARWTISNPLTDEREAAHTPWTQPPHTPWTQPPFPDTTPKQGSSEWQWKVQNTAAT